MMVFLEKFVLVLTTGSALLILGSNPFGFDPKQRVSSVAALAAFAVVLGAHLEIKASKKKLKQSRALRISAWSVIVVCGTWFIGHTLAVHQGIAVGVPSTSTPTPSGAVKQETSGANSPAISNVGGSVTVNSVQQNSSTKRTR